MLNEKLRDITRIGHPNILVQIVSSILHGTDSLDSLRQLLYTLYGTSYSECQTSILLLESMGLVAMQGDLLAAKQELLESFNQQEEQKYTEIFSSLYLEYVIDEQILNLDNVEYDFTTDSYKLPRKCIKLSFAAYRNLLIELEILIAQSDGYYSVSNLLYEYIAKNNNAAKKNLEKLKQELEKDEEIGEAGELFVLQYEKDRLNEKSRNKVKQISHIDVTAGFDIVSVMDDESKHKGEQHPDRQRDNRELDQKSDQQLRRRFFLFCLFFIRSFFLSVLFCFIRRYLSSQNVSFLFGKSCFGLCRLSFTIRHFPS